MLSALFVSQKYNPISAYLVIYFNAEKLYPTFKEVENRGNMMLLVKSPIDYYGE